MQRTRIIKTSCWFAGTTFFICGALLDSGTWIPYILCSLSIIWLTLVATANYPYYPKKGEKQ